MKFKNLCPLMALAVTLLFWGIATNRAAAETPAGPKAFLTETQYHFGAVPEGEKVRHPFILQNRGTAPLTIIDVKTD